MDTMYIELFLTIIFCKMFDLQYPMFHDYLGKMNKLYNFVLYLTILCLISMLYLMLMVPVVVKWFVCLFFFLLLMPVKLLLLSFLVVFFNLDPMSQTVQGR